MGFTKTDEGRVFFKNADNDDAHHKKNGSAPEPVMPSDSTQMQILLLLKSLNTKLKNSKNDQTALRSELVGYKATIKELEKKTAAHENNYIDLEQKVSMKQQEANKKSSRVEESVKKTLKQLEEARNLVKILESKSNTRDNSLEALKEKLNEQKQREQKIVERQTLLEGKQKEQGEKMVNNVAAYVALTKRVSDGETRYDTLDNKIEDVASEYLKLDRKIDKAIEDRNRILRKVDRIEQAVLETRDALNAKAMVLLTDQGVAGVDMPNITDKNLKTDPSVLSRRIQEEALMPWWRRPIRIQMTSLAIIVPLMLLVGWLMNEMAQNVSQKTLTKSLPPTVSLDTSPEELSFSSTPSQASTYKDIPEPLENYSEEDLYAPQDSVGINTSENGISDIDETEYGIKIHKGYIDPSEVQSDQNTPKVLDVYNETNLAQVFEKDPERVARALNEIEPSSLTTKDMDLSGNTETREEELEKIPEITNAQNIKTEYLTGLKNRIKPDPKLTDIAKKIETQAFEGVPEAQHDMGAIYVAGHGDIQQNLERAVLWFNEAATNNVANAKYNLGVLYHQGIGVDKSIEKAMTLYSEAAEQNHPEAQYNLGIANIEGIGVPYNPERAAYYFERAANRGVTEAAYNLGLIYENGLLGSTQPDEALAWYKTAADQGSPEAQSALDQLAASLGIGINEVNRIVEQLQEEKRQNPAPTNSYSNTNTHITAEIQRELMQRGLYPGPVDGMSGPMTANAIREFQRSANLDVDGKASEDLLSYIRSYSGYR